MRGWKHKGIKKARHDTHLLMSPICLQKWNGVVPYVVNVVKNVSVQSSKACPVGGCSRGDLARAQKPVPCPPEDVLHYATDRKR